MAKRHTGFATAFAAAVAMAVAAPLAAQPQVINVPFNSLLPDGDFVWPWGDVADVAAEDRADLNIDASDMRWRCNLQAEFTTRGQFEIGDARDVENALRSSINFIEQTYYLMQEYEFERYIDWARLDCRVAEVSVAEQELREREERALERAERRRERRRANDDDEEEDEE